MVYFNTELVQNLGHINVFLGVWAQLFYDNLGTRRLAIELEGTQVVVVFICFWQFQEHKKVTVLNNNLPEKVYSNKTMYIIHARKQNYVHTVVIRKRHGRCTFNNKNLRSL